ncbi:MAG: DUF5597 domain-containing protein, partial [Terriglobales bacterium]
PAWTGAGPSPLARRPDQFAAGRRRATGAVFAAALGVLALALTLMAQPAPTYPPPHLAHNGQAVQLMVNGQPFLMLAGELHNSSASSLAYMRPIWPRLKAMHLNTVVVPLSWELVEPREGQFDFRLLDGLLAQARAQNLHVVFLWLASWKNGLSSYAPLWVKEDPARFPRAVIQGRPTAILSPLATATRQADATAFAAVMRHIRQVDGAQHTVLMMQVENEVGILGASRDHSSAANRAFYAPVPPRLMNYLEAHKLQLDPALLRLWRRHGAQAAGSWPQVFGHGARAGEIFMAWYYARYINAVAAAGKAAYPLPMYVNTWLAGPGAPPGTFPSGGPLPFVQAVWRAAGSAIDIFSPDLYAPNFTAWCQSYHRNGNPLWMPETTNGPQAAANVFYAVGAQDALGFSPFAIDTPYPYSAAAVNPAWFYGSDLPVAAPTLAESYRALSQLWPWIQRAEQAGTIRGFVLSASAPQVEFNLNGYRLHISRDALFGRGVGSGFGLIMADGPGRFFGAGRGFQVTFTSLGPGGNAVALGWVDEGHIRGGAWVPGRRLNGDETSQGQAWRFDDTRMHFEKAGVYRARP